MRGRIRFLGVSPPSLGARFHHPFVDCPPARLLLFFLAGANTIISLPSIFQNRKKRRKEKSFWGFMIQTE